MFAVSRQNKELSPIRMPFNEWWIYDLKNFHEFWKNKARKDPQLFLGQSAWEALLKAEKINLFTSLYELQNFALKFHLFFENPISPTQIDKVFSHFHRLGLHKVGNLRKIPRDQIQKRLGKLWGEFFNAILFPEKALWPWKSFSEEEVIRKTWQADEGIIHSEILLENSCRLLNEIHEQNKNLFLEKLEIELVSLEDENDCWLDFYFPHRPPLAKNLGWLRRLIEERLQCQDLTEPVSCLKLYLKPAKSQKQVQLHLFKNQFHQIQWQELCQKLKAQNFEVFQPQMENSHLPEKSWSKAFPKEEVFSSPTSHQLKPLIQFEAQKISRPQGKIYFIERIASFDETGHFIQRDYYAFYSRKKWRWIFEDLSGQWFEQGIIE